MVTTINYSTSVHSSNINLTKCKTWGLPAKHAATDPCGTHLVPGSKMFTRAPTGRHKSTTLMGQYTASFPNISLMPCAGKKKKKWDKQKRKGKTTPFLLRMEAVAQQWCTPQPCSDYHKFPSADVPFFLKPRNDCLWACGKGASQRNSEPRTPNLQTLLM